VGSPSKVRSLSRVVSLSLKKVRSLNRVVSLSLSLSRVVSLMRSLRRDVGSLLGVCSILKTFCIT
jgi:hypothetical protein